MFNRKRYYIISLLAANILLWICLYNPAEYLEELFIYLFLFSGIYLGTILLQIGNTGLKGLQQVLHFIIIASSAFHCIASIIVIGLLWTFEVLPILILTGLFLAHAFCFFLAMQQLNSKGPDLVQLDEELPTDNSTPNLKELD